MSDDFRPVDPDEAYVEIEGRKFSVRELAKAQDEVRAGHVAAVGVHPFENVEVKGSGAAGAAYQIKGSASVFNRWYKLWPGISERVVSGAFDEVLGSSPDVHALWDHDTRYVLGRTKNETLELKSSKSALNYWALPAATSYAADLRTLLERKDIDQSSFAFIVEEDSWEMKENDQGQEVYYRSIEKISDLFDVTITARGANPYTDSSLARSAVRASLLDGPKSFVIRNQVSAAPEGVDSESPQPPLDDESPHVPVDDEPIKRTELAPQHSVAGETYLHRRK